MYRTSCRLALIGLVLLLALTPAGFAADGPLRFAANGHTDLGDWEAAATVSTDNWRPGREIRIGAALQMTEEHLAALAAAKIRADGFCLLVTAERTFDADGRLRLPSDEKMSTLLTPTGLAIEGGVQGAVTARFGYGFRTPVDEFATLPLTAVHACPGRVPGGFRHPDQTPGQSAARYLSAPL